MQVEKVVQQAVEQELLLLIHLLVQVGSTGGAGSFFSCYYWTNSYLCRNTWSYT
jgi:hypothetical protein